MLRWRHRLDATDIALPLALEKLNIESRPLWKPMHRQLIFSGARVVGGAVSEDFFAKGICLPSGTLVTEGQLEQICSIIKGVGR